MGVYFCAPQKEIKETRNVNLLFVGDSGVGKTSIINQICYGKFENSLPSTECQVSHSYTMTPQLRIIMKDNGGAERYMSCMAPSMVAKADAIIYVYSQSDINSLRSIQVWQKHVKMLLSECPLHQPKEFLIANKADKIEKIGEMTRKIQEGEYVDFLHSFSTSASSGSDLGSIFKLIVEDIKNKKTSFHLEYEPVMLKYMKDDGCSESLDQTTDEDLINFINS